MTDTRCPWCKADALYIDYHDKEWGVPIYNDQQLFEFLILETMQAGLSWITILKKRNAFREAFCQFNPEKIALFTDKKIEQLLQNEKIIRNRRKIEACVNNAKAFLKLQEKTSFNDFLWQFVDGKPIKNKWRQLKQIPANTHVSDNMTKALKQHGFKFVGSTTCYAFMQAVGMVNDHLVSCFRYRQV